jgi:uncharacterized protein (TIGR02996 family)
MTTTRESLEAALAAEPENVALHSAYADLLIEEGDPRGEYIRLELINPDIRFVDDSAERSRLESSWFGSLEEYRPVKPMGVRYGAEIDDRVNSLAVHWSLGWFDVAVISRDYCAIVAVIGSHPLSRLLRELYLYNPADRESLTGGEFATILDDMGTLPIRNWLMYGFESLGDEIVERMVERPGMQSLRSLDLSRCGLTDDGAQMLANSRFVLTLESLRLGDNYLSPIGIASLAEIGFAIGPQRGNPGWDDDD